MVLFGAAGGLTVVEAVLVGLVAGIVVQNDWRPGSETIFYLAVFVALAAALRRKLEKFIDSQLESSEDTKQQAVIVAALEEYERRHREGPASNV